MGLQHPFILVDTNHDNSGKKFAEQIRIVRETLTNRSWNPIIHDVVRGFMIESYLEEVVKINQKYLVNRSQTQCLGWEKTESLVREIYQYVAE